MIVVSDASPLISLSAIGQLDILRTLFGELRVPEAVAAEVLESGDDRPGMREVASAAWIKSEAIVDTSLMRALLEDLDRGEAEAIVLALQTGAGLILMDERRGRSAARRLGLRPLGVLGVLIEGKRRGMVPAVGPVLDRLQADAGFRVSEALRESVLQAVGEVTP